ncbi:MAG: FeoB-associated Cys-rich membrane protein [Muribaculaceae bacterium]|nr:FeoB-associated Cys-rich membrane protein [Muribaculaceae bacterium]
MPANQAYSTDIIIQYSIVGLIILAACLWIMWKLLKKRKEGISSCCGCTLSDTCNKKIVKERVERIKEDKRG